MNYVKHSNRRVNLANVTCYKPNGKIEILFSTTGTDTNKYISWKFNSEEARDNVLENLDKFIGLKDFTPEGHQPENPEMGGSFI